MPLLLALYVFSYTSLVFMCMLCYVYFLPLLFCSIFSLSNNWLAFYFQLIVIFSPSLHLRSEPMALVTLASTFSSFPSLIKLKHFFWFSRGFFCRLGCLVAVYCIYMCELICINWYKRYVLDGVALDGKS